MASRRPPVLGIVVSTASAVLVVVCALLLLVVPQFREVFEELPAGEEGLSAVTRIMMSVTAWLAENVWVALAVVLLLNAAAWVRETRAQS